MIANETTLHKIPTEISITVRPKQINQILTPEQDVIKVPEIKNVKQVKQEH